MDTVKSAILIILNLTNKMAECSCFCHRTYNDCNRDCCVESEQQEIKEVIEYYKQFDKKINQDDQIKKLQSENDELRAQLGKVGYPTHRTRKEL